jgi:hypothetical protein
VFEVRSPGDETYEKLSFHAEAGVEAAVVVERDTKASQMFGLADGSFVLTPPSEGGWTLIRPIGVEIRTESTDHGSEVHLRIAGSPQTDHPA